MTSGTNIKDRCRLCYTRLKDSSSSSHHKFWCSQQNHRIVNIYKHRPYSYRDFIVRYLSLNLPDKTPLDPYSQVICGTCAASLDKLDTAFRSFEQTQKNLRSKYRKTSQIIHYQFTRQMQTPSTLVNQPQVRSSNEQLDDKLVIPKRQSKRKGAPKHIDQSVNQTRKTSSALQLIVRIRSPNRNDDETQNLFSSKPTSPQRKPFPFTDDILTETTNHKKRFKRAINDCDSSNISYNCINLLKPSTSTDTLHLTTSGSISSPINSRPTNSVKGNHIERIAVSLLSGTETQSDLGNDGHLSNGTTDHNLSQTRKRRKPTSSPVVTLEATSTNNILSSNMLTTYNNVATSLSPSLDEPDDDDVSNDSSTVSTSALQHTNNSKTTVPNVNEQLSSTISTTPTAEGLTITAINQTGQKQVFMAKQLGNLKKYQCGLCEKVVTNIQIHVRRHTNDKPYPCTYCEKRFTNSGDLQIHVRIHTGEKPYACPLCLKSYRTIGNFNSHVKTHDSGTRPHRCELCNQTFPIPKDWYSHLRSSHRSRIPVASPSLNSPNTTTTVTKPLFSNAVTSQQQYSEVFVPNKVKLEPLNRSQLSIKSSTMNDQEPVNMSKKENSNDVDEDEDEEEDDEEENHHQSTHNLLTNVSSPVVHV